MRKAHLAVLVVALAFVLAIPAAAADRVIDNGIDLWVTRGDGSTFRDFSQEPIPAGFFCAKSEPFTDQIVFRGVPVVTSEPGLLGATDTIVQRLDDAVFNKKGVAQTRIQVRALSFESVAPIKTSCGLFNVKVTLDGEQPITTMRIIRQNEKGGSFLSPIWVDVKLIFTPVGRPADREKSGERLELTRSLRFAPNPHSAWSHLPGKGGRQVTGFALVDTDGDRVPETYLPGTSNFAAGWRTSQATTKAAAATCHCDESCYYQHCTWAVADQPVSDTNSNN